MKKLITTIVLTAFLTAGLTFAQTLETVKTTDTRYDSVVENLLIGMKSDNIGLQTSSAYWLGEMQSDKAVVPLMKMFRSHSDQRAQLMAAQSLAKIEDLKGIFLVKRVGEFSDDKRMQRVCKQLYIGYLNNKDKSSVEVEGIYQAKLVEAEKFVELAIAGK